MLLPFCLAVGFKYRWIIELVLTVKPLLSPKRRPDVLLVLKKSSGDMPSSVPKAKYIPLGFLPMFHSSSRFFISVFRLEAKNKITPSMMKNDMGTMPIPKTTTPPGKEGNKEKLIIQEQKRGSHNKMHPCQPGRSG